MDDDNFKDSSYSRHRDPESFNVEDYEDPFDIPCTKKARHRGPESFNVEDYENPFDIPCTKKALARLRPWRQAVLVLNVSRRFRYTLDLKNEEGKQNTLRKIREHAQAIRSAHLFQIRVQAHDSILFTSSGYEKEEEFDVFVCCTGKTRGGFTSHLVKELNQFGLRTFTDELIPRGEDISDALIGGIHGSMSTMVVISKDFAASSWCLDEVVESFKWKEIKGGRHLIFPIFYKVDPSELRHFRDRTAQHLALQEKKYGINSDKVAWWKTCLFLLSNIAGWHLINDRTNESAFIQIIVKEVGKTLRMKNVALEL